MHNNVNNSMGTANPSGIVWQPVTMAPANTSNYNIGNKTAAIRTFSIISIVLGVLSIFIQIAALVIYAESIYSYVYYPLDVIGHGIWCGAFYLTAGSLGVAACGKAKKSLLVGTVVMSSISIAGAIVASTLSGISASNGVSYRCYSNYYPYDGDLCDAWLGLEWTLMCISILAFMNAITLVSLASLPFCCGGRNNGPQGNTKVTIGVGSNQQPMDFQPQPMYFGAQQQSNVQVANSGQNQYPQQVQYPQQQQVQFFPNSQVVVPQQQQKPQLQQLQHPQQQQPQQPQQAPVAHQQQQQQNQPSQYDQLKVQLHAMEN